MNDLKKVLLALSADNARRNAESASATAVAPVDEPVILESEKDRRIYKYIVDLYGKNRVFEAIGKIKGKRKPYVSNVVKILGVKIPDIIINPAVLKNSEQKAIIARQNFDFARRLLDNE